jgi:hypothetical protein
MSLLGEDHDMLDHALLSGQLTTERLAELAPRTRWTRIETHPQVVAQPYVVGLGTYLQPQRDGLRAIVTLDLADDLGAGNWLHLSVSRERRLPTWGGLNVHPYCLHLLHRLDGDAVPRLLWEGQEGGDGSRYEHGKGAR